MNVHNITQLAKRTRTKSLLDDLIAANVRNIGKLY